VIFDAAQLRMGFLVCPARAHRKTTLIWPLTSTRCCLFHFTTRATLA
jgi:hypothetical protein